MRYVSLLFLALAMPTAAQDASLRVRIGETGVVLAAGDLRALPQRTVSVAEDGAQTRYEGPRLADVLVRAGTKLGAEPAGGGIIRYVAASSPDGFRAVFSLAEIDPDYAEREVILAMRRNDAPLIADEGPFRLVVPGDKRRTRWVRQVDTLAVLTAPVVK